MSSFQITVVVVSAVLVFWAVGAYNRLMRLRNAILMAFTPVDEQLRLRLTLLQQQVDAWSDLMPEHAQMLSALRAALAQVHAAGAHARARPAVAASIGSLRLAEDILQETRGRLPTSAQSHETLTVIVEQLAAVEVALKFARSRFNEAVMEYNIAVGQFPTWLLAGLFGFREAGNF